MNFTLDHQEIDSRKAEKLVLLAMTQALGLKEVAEAIAPFKCRGIITGHKVLDDDRAVQMLLEHAPDPLRATIKAQKLTPFRLTQILNQVLRRKLEMKHGKLTGKLKW